MSKANFEPIEFLASLPPIGTAIKRSGNNDGMRVQIDIPESEMGNAIRLNLCGQKVLKVTVEVMDGDGALNRSKDCAKNGSEEGNQANRKQANRRTAKRPTDVDRR